MRAQARLQHRLRVVLVHHGANRRAEGRRRPVAGDVAVVEAEGGEAGGTRSEEVPVGLRWRLLAVETLGERRERTVVPKGSGLACCRA